MTKHNLGLPFLTDDRQTLLTFLVESTLFNAPFQSDALRTHDARKIDAGGNNADISSWHVQARTHPRSLLVPTRFGTERDDLHLRKSPSIRLHSRE